MNYLWPEEEQDFSVDPAVMARRLAPVPSFLSMGREAGKLYVDNILSMGLMTLIHLGVMIVLMGLMGLTMKIFGSQAAGLMLGLLLLLALVGPAMRMIACHLAVNIWDESSASPLEAAAFARSLYFKSFFTYLWALYYEADLWARALPSIWPGLLTAAVTHAVLHFGTDIEGIFFWDALVFAVITVPLAVSRLWKRIRRIHFLYSFAAFEIIDGKSVFAEDLSEEQPGFWRGRFARLFYRLNDEWWHDPLNKAAVLCIIKNLIWMTPAVLIAISGMSALGKFYIIAVFILTLRYALGLWYDIAAAGWFRENLSSGKYY